MFLTSFYLTQKNLAKYQKVWEIFSAQIGLILKKWKVGYLIHFRGLWPQWNFC